MKNLYFVKFSIFLFVFFVSIFFIKIDFVKADLLFDTFGTQASMTTSVTGSTIDQTAYLNGAVWTANEKYNISSISYQFTSTVTGVLQLCVTATTTKPVSSYNCEYGILSATSSKSNTSLEQVNFNINFTTEIGQKYFLLFKTNVGSGISQRVSAQLLTPLAVNVNNVAIDTTRRAIIQIFGTTVLCPDCPDCPDCETCTVYPNEYPTELNQYPDLSIDFSKAYTYTGSSTDPIETTYTFKYSAWRQYLYILSLAMILILTIFTFKFLIKKK